MIAWIERALLPTVILAISGCAYLGHRPGYAIRVIIKPSQTGNPKDDLIILQSVNPAYEPRQFYRDELVFLHKVRYVRFKGA